MCSAIGAKQFVVQEAAEITVSDPLSERLIVYAEDNRRQIVSGRSGNDDFTSRRHSI